jgi:ribosomal protein L33
MSAKKKNRIMLKSEAIMPSGKKSPARYTTLKNPKKPGKLRLMKYDSYVRQHVYFSESSGSK